MKRITGINRGKAPGASRLWCALALVLLSPLLAARVQAEDGPSMEPASLDSSIADSTLDLKIRRALKTDTDAHVRALASSFSVHHGMVVFWGTVPSEEVMQRAMSRVKAVPGVGRVRSEAIVFQPAQPRPQLRLPLTTEPTRTRSASINPLADPFAPRAESGAPQAPGDLRPGSAPLPLRPARPTQTTGRDVGTQTPARTTPTTRTAPEKNPFSAPATISLLPPRPVAEPQAPHAAPAPSVAAAIERLRRGDARFRAIHVEVEAGVVRLTAPQTPAEDLATFAQAISEIAGVVRVVVRTEAP